MGKLPKHDAPADWFKDPDRNQPSGLTKDNAVWVGRATAEAGKARHGKLDREGGKARSYDTRGSLACEKVVTKTNVPA